MSHIWIELGATAVGGVLVGGGVGGMLAGVYRAIDAERQWPRWLDASAVTVAHLLAAGAAWALAHYAAPDLQYLGHRTAGALAVVGAVCAPSFYRPIRAAALRAIGRRLDAAGPADPPSGAP